MRGHRSLNGALTTLFLSRFCSLLCLTARLNSVISFDGSKQHLSGRPGREHGAQDLGSYCHYQPISIHSETWRAQPSGSR